MFVHSIKLINFKSFGDYSENEVIIEPRVTAVIGKNESGKSNVLDGLSHIGFLKKKNTAFALNDVNRNDSSQKEIKYFIVLKPSAEDFARGIVGDTQIELTSTSAIVSGSILRYYLGSIKECFDDFVSFLESDNNNPFQYRNQDLVLYRKTVQELQSEVVLDLYDRMTSLEYFRARTNIFPVNRRQEYAERISKIQDDWNAFGSLFPTFFYRKSDMHLSATYKYEDVEKELKGENANPHSLLYRLVKLIDVPTHDFLLAVRAGSEGRVESIRMRIQKRAEEKINRPFREFYKTEDISLHISFNANVVTFLVQSGNGEALTFSERSNGLRWYLETFIDARANNISDRNVVYLLDEPGVSLHVNAQRELLSLFEHLANQGNQVVYTTHSPYMLNTEHEGIHCIRAVVKDETGFSRIYKNAYDARIAQESQQDTLAPIIAALGMNLNDTFGPAKDKINIVTEGMSDYIYLNTMVKQLGISMEKCVFIPSVGATNCVHICQILHGWGCRYMALFDYDKTGVESGGEYMRKKMLFEEGKQYCYIKNVSPDEIARKTYVASPYMIEDVMIYSEIERFCEETGNAKTLGKPLTAKLMCAAIESGTFIVSPKSLENFKQLLEKILSLHK